MRAKEMGTVTAMEIANALGQSKRTINLRAKKEGWKFTSVKARGGKIPHYDVSSLPHDVRSALAISIAVTVPCTDPTLVQKP